jgi:hypothetical protein
MYYIFESILVGMYSLLIYVCFNFVKVNATIKIFMVGFIKHLLGYLLNIHTYYCNNGYACLKYQKQLHYDNVLQMNPHRGKKVAKISITSLVVESGFEGCLFVMLNIFLLKFKLKNNYIRIFLLGVMLHIIFEFLQLHIYFCKRCVSIRV